MGKALKMRTIVALCLVASALANSVDWSSLESRDHHIQAVKSVKASFPGLTRLSAHAHDKAQSCCQMVLLYLACGRQGPPTCLKMRHRDIFSRTCCDPQQRPRKFLLPSLIAFRQVFSKSFKLARSFTFSCYNY